MEYRASKLRNDNKLIQIKKTEILSNSDGHTRLYIPSHPINTSNIFLFLLLICDDLGILPQALISNIIADSLFRNYETAMQCSLRSKIWAAITDYSCYPKEPQTKDTCIPQTKLEESESGVGNSEMIMFWCKSITNHLKSHKKFNETAQTDNFTDYTMWHLNFFLRFGL